jgi:hypothetical protein
MYGLGVTLDVIQKVCSQKALSKKPPSVDEAFVKSMADKVKFEEYFNQQSQYSNYSLFFQREMKIKGVKMALDEHVGN